MSAAARTVINLEGSITHVEVPGQLVALGGAIVDFDITSTPPDTTPPALSGTDISEASEGPTQADVTFTADEDCDYDIWITTNASAEDEGDVATNAQASGSATGSVEEVVSGVLGVIPGTNSYAHVRVEDPSANVDVIVIGPLLTTAYTATNTYDGSTIGATSLGHKLANTSDSGSDTTMVDADFTALLSAKGITFVDDYFNGLTLHDDDNTTSVEIVDTIEGDNEITFLTGSVDASGGIAYRITDTIANGDKWYAEGVWSVVSEAMTGKYYISNSAGTLFSETVEQTFTGLTGVADGDYNATIAADGSLTLTPVVDEIAPTVDSAAIDAAGTSLTITHDESVDFGAGGNGGFALSTGQTLTYSSGSGTTDLVYSISPAVEITDSPTLAYTQPTDGVEDAAGNDLATFSGQSITNNSLAGISAAPGGDVVGSVQTLIHDTGATLTLTLTNDTWIAAGTGPIGTIAQSKAIIAGITSAQVEAGGWNTTVRDVLDDDETNIARTSDTVATLTIPATAGYVITANETITATIANAVLTLATGDVTASTFTIYESSSTIGLVRGITQGLTQNITQNIVR